MREKAQGLKELSVILIGAELNNLYSSKSPPHPLKVFCENTLNDSNGFVSFLLYLLQFLF